MSKSSKQERKGQKLIQEEKKVQKKYCYLLKV